MKRVAAWRRVVVAVVVACVGGGVVMGQNTAGQNRAGQGRAGQNGGETDTTATPVVEAGTIVGDFSRNYNAAMRKYTEQQEIVLRGKVQKVNITKTPDGKTLVRVNVMPREPGSSTMVPIFVDFAPAMEGEVRKLKEGDLVEITATYMPVPPAPMVHEIRGFVGDKLKAGGPDQTTAKLREEVVTWISKNNALGPQSGVVKDLTPKVEEALSKGEDLRITFGKGLMSSGKVTMLCVQDGKMLVLVPSPAQADAMKVKEMGAAVSATPSTALRMPAEVEMALPVLEGGAGGGDTWHMAKPLRAKASVKEVTSTLMKPGDYGIRMVVYAGGKREVFFSSFHGLPGIAVQPLLFGVLPREIDLLGMKEGEMLPAAVFFEVVRRIGEDPTGDPDKVAPNYEVISEAKGMVMMVGK